MLHRTQLRIFTALFLFAAFATFTLAFASSNAETSEDRRDIRNSATLETENNQQVNTRPCPTCPEPTEQTIYAPTIGLPEATTSEIVLNSRSPRVMRVVPTFYTAEGAAIVGQTIRLQPTEMRFVSIESLIPVEHRGRHLWGGMSLSYTGNLMEVWAQIALYGFGRAGGAADVTFNVLNNRGSDVQEAVWRTPERGAAILAFGNSSSAPVRATLQFADGERQEIALEAFATRYVRRPSGNRSDAVRVTIESGAVGALKAVGVITRGGGDFAGSVRFVDPQAVVQPNLFATNARLRNTVPHLLLRNVGGETITARARFLAATGEAGEPIELPVVTVRPQETIEVNLRSLVMAAARREDMESVSVQIINSGAAGSLIGALYSTDRTTNIAYDVPLRDSGRVRTSTGSYPWRTDGDYTTNVTITNVGTQAGRFHVDIRYAGGSYFIPPREIAAGETATFDLREIQREQEPDNQGRTLPPAITSGQFHWSVTGMPGASKLVGRAEVVSRERRASNSYSCPTCCPDSGPYAEILGTATMFVGGNSLLSTAGEMRDCYNYPTPTGGVYMAWTVMDAGIASVSELSGYSTQVNGISVGETNVFGRYDYVEWWDDWSGGDSCQPMEYRGENAAPVSINRLRVTVSTPLLVPPEESGPDRTAIVAGESLPIILEAVDVNGNVNPGVTDTLNVTPSRELDPSETGLPSSVTLMNGQYAGSVRLNRVRGTERGTTFRFTLARGTTAQPLDYFFYIYFRVIASREGLVGGLTACGHTIQPNDRFVALPSTGLCNVGVTIRNPASGAFASTTVRDVGPWFPHASATQGNPCVGGNDPYWNTGGVPRVLTTSCDVNNAAIDLADGTFSDVGLSGTGQVIWRFN